MTVLVMAALVGTGPRLAHAAADQAESDGSKATRERTEPGEPGVALVVTGGVFAGVGAAVALGGGIGFGVLARRRSDALDEIQDGGNPEGASLSDAEAIEQEGKRFEALQLTFAAAGALVGITGVVLLTLGMDKREKALDAADVRLVPRWTKNAAGLSIVGRF